MNKKSKIYEILRLEHKSSRKYIKYFIKVNPLRLWFPAEYIAQQEFCNTVSSIAMGESFLND